MATSGRRRVRGPAVSGQVDHYPGPLQGDRFGEPVPHRYGQRGRCRYLAPRGTFRIVNDGCARTFWDARSGDTLAIGERRRAVDMLC